MANRTYLIQSPSSAPANYSPGSDILVASKYSIPIFWYALFDGSSIVAKLAEMEDGSSIPYPFLITTTAAAKARFAQLRIHLQAILPHNVATAFDDFAGLLHTVECSHIHLETIELWMMDEPDKFQPHVEACLRAFELLKCGIASATLPSIPEWRELLGQVQIEAEDIAGSVKHHMLTGSGWIRPVTWNE